ncbi:MAG: hypothetical protein WC547_08520, partial [Candidatus Omnitrophota bacterium]
MKKIIKFFSFSMLVVCFILLILFPLYIMFRISLGTAQDIFSQQPGYFPEQITVDHFVKVFS